MPTAPKWLASTQELQSRESFLELLRSYASDNTEFNTKLSDINNSNYPIVPGLLGAWSVDYETKSAEWGNGWIPQGISLVESKIYISAYDSFEKLTSLIYVLDSKTGEYEKSIVLPFVAHVGGMAYDSIHKKLWISTDEKKIARVSAIDLKTLEEYDATSIKSPIKVDESYIFQWLKTTSSLAYCASDNSILIPKFSISESEMFRINLDNMGKIGDKKQLEDKTEVSHAKIPSQVQGFSYIEDDKIGIFNSSYGNKNLKMRFMKFNFKNEQEFTIKEVKTQKNSAYNFSMPPYLEQLTLENRSRRVFLLFESGGISYRDKTQDVMDRILSITWDYEQLQNDIKN
ncbi:hypothetical protein LMK05_07405 [Lactococcus petauri]|nr:hypothetical protein LMK05_07405 [Lactococcus petauri]